MSEKPGKIYPEGDEEVISKVRPEGGSASFRVDDDDPVKKFFSDPEHRTGSGDAPEKVRPGGMGGGADVAGNIEV